METEGNLSLARASRPDDQRALIERARQGDPSAHRALYDTHVDRVYRLTFRMTGNEHLAREVTQDTFVRAFAGLEGFREDASIATWLHSIAVSLSLNAIKRQKRERTRNTSLDDAGSIAAPARRSDPLLREKLMQAVNELPEGCRTVFMMHDAEGYTHDEIAKALGIAEGTSKAQLARARQKLRVSLAQFAGEWK
jgi:RNA polymerase sigma-70 factor, ECF subfamily